MDIEEMLETCESASNIPKHNGGPDFTQWELEFLESVREQFDSRGSVSEKQEQILSKMYDKT